MRGSAQPESGWCTSVPTSGTPWDHTATRFHRQLYVWPTRCLNKHKDPCWPQFVPPFALQSYTFLLWPQVFKLPLPGHVRGRTDPGIHSLRPCLSSIYKATELVGWQHMHFCGDDDNVGCVFQIWVRHYGKLRDQSFFFKSFR